MNGDQVNTTRPVQYLAKVGNKTVTLEGLASNGAVITNRTMYFTLRPHTDPPVLPPAKNAIRSPTKKPTLVPSKKFTNKPTLLPTKNLTHTSTTKVPTLKPIEARTKIPTLSPSKIPTVPTKKPTILPTNRPTLSPTKRPTLSPSARELLPPFTTPGLKADLALYLWDTSQQKQIGVLTNGTSFDVSHLGTTGFSILATKVGGDATYTRITRALFVWWNITSGSTLNRTESAEPWFMNGDINTTARSAPYLATSGLKQLSVETLSAIGTVVTKQHVSFNLRR
jgi:hypothetical protein